MSNSSYQHEMKRWQAVLQKAAEPEKKAEAHLHLAAFYLAKDNLQKDYHKAYVELIKATAIWPDLQENMAFVSWFELLAILENESQIARHDIVGLETKLAQAQQNIGAQNQELAKLRETLDKLKRLEMSVERKRRALK